MSVPVISIDLPEYQVTSEPKYRVVGKVVDDAIRRYFPSETLVVRAIGSQEHPGKTVDELIEVIQKLGTDRYDPARKGDRYDTVGGKRIDFFAFRRKMTPTTELFKDIAYGFYRSAIGIHGRPTRIDILIVYDAAQLKAVLHRYEGRADFKRDGFVFKDPSSRTTAIRAIIKITG